MNSKKIIDPTNFYDTFEIRKLSTITPVYKYNLKYWATKSEKKILYWRDEYYKATVEPSGSGNLWLDWC